VLDAPEQLKEAAIRRLKDELEQLEPVVLKPRTGRGKQATSLALGLLTKTTSDTSDGLT
jgi:hypothetical protein